MDRKSYTKISGHRIDIENRKIIPSEITISNGQIIHIEAKETADDQYILPGFIDAHIHIESSMVTPYAFAKVALQHGTTATVSDPHEIANVCGIEGVQYMINDAKNAGLRFFFGAPSCVPATSFENAGAYLHAKDVDELLSSDDIYYLSEMMNYPGVLSGDVEVMSKIGSAQKYQKPIDGHAPGLLGADAAKYISAGITTDHECVGLDEAKNKIKNGMKILIREGSAAKNFEALHPLISDCPNMLMFCSDDKHPDDLLEGHLNLIVKRAVELGHDLFDVLKIACLNPIDHYRLPIGKLQVGDAADFIVVKDLKDWQIISNYIGGIPYYDQNKCTLPVRETSVINQFLAKPITLEDIQKEGILGVKTPVIVAVDGALITEKEWAVLPVKNGNLQAIPSQDILKICVVNRYDAMAKPAVGFIKNFGLQACAMASTVAHDSHNIIALGDDDLLIVQAINTIIASKGGLCAATYDDVKHIALPIAGLMSDQSVEDVGSEYKEISNFVRSRACPLNAPFMTLSFMALLVIPKIKISDQGMFDAEAFRFYSDEYHS